MKTGKNSKTGYALSEHAKISNSQKHIVPVCLAIKNPLVADGGDVSVPNEAR